ncbi:MFS transporter [Stappia taiwanensis]|uniref:MFS transporter n=1 Tax=Stappia taiwanensis TaxID=992267 RepID=A0A838XU50_9HYPH|nr:MFS transporter [Stappia taiwanensis]MBA4612046.1 MFS transporter [Stappia taiwanensis]GGE91496.1 MFS transporter [Stappia taiwanensis]
MVQILPVAALLAGSALLLLAGGLHGLLLPLRGSAEGFSDTSLGLLGTGWAIGYVAGCLMTPIIVSRVGHIRSFGVFCSLAAIVVLLNLLILHPAGWIPLRAVSGFCFAGAAMVVESWLNERATPESRGRIFGLYTMINLGATTAGQMLLIMGDPAGYFFFVLGSIVYSMALLPTALSTAAAPTPLAQARLDLKALWHNSPVAVTGVFLVGISNSAFGTLGAVYGRQIGLSVTSIASMMSIALLAGALIQLPIGMLSDRMDRRFVLIGLAACGCLIGALLSLGSGFPVALTIALVGAFGGMVYSMYPVIVAHANDHSPPGEFLKTSGGLLLLFGAGSVVGPLLAAILMTVTTPSGLFGVTSAAHGTIIAFTLWRITQRKAVAPEEREDFVAMASATRFSTPEALSLDPRAEEELEDDSADLPDQPEETLSQRPACT